MANAHIRKFGIIERILFSRRILKKHSVFSETTLRLMRILMSILIQFDLWLVIHLPPSIHPCTYKSCRHGWHWTWRSEKIVSTPPVPIETCIRITANQISNGQRKRYREIEKKMKLRLRRDATATIGLPSWISNRAQHIPCGIAKEYWQILRATTYRLRLEFNIKR